MPSRCRTPRAGLGTADMEPPSANMRNALEPAFFLFSRVFPCHSCTSTSTAWKTATTTTWTSRWVKHYWDQHPVGWGSFRFPASASAVMQSIVAAFQYYGLSNETEQCEGYGQV